METNDSVVSDDDKRHIRLLYLVLKGGRLVLKHRIDKEIGIPPTNWLKAQKTKIEALRGNIIRQSQFEILYPSSGDSSSEKYDVTLLVALYRNFVSKHRSNHPIWKPENTPSANDYSTEADYVRLRNYRNELVHANCGQTKMEFEAMWKHIEEVLMRLGKDIPNLGRQIENIESLCLDEEDETITEQLKQWENLENLIIKEVLAHSLLEMALERSKKEINDDLGKHFVETNYFRKAQKILENKKILILKGAQGEGKTTFSKRLVKDPNSCLKINTPDEWSYCSNERVKTVLIDDIFGRAMFEKDECRKWLKNLPHMIDAIEKKRLNVIITSRSYILEDAFYKMHMPVLITSIENTLTISSEKLSDEEKQKILLSHMKLAGKTVDADFAEKCVKQSNQPTSYIVGFPQCAKVFCERIYLFENKENKNEGKQSEDFFKTPMFHIQECLETIFESYDVFLAFSVLWFQRPQELKLFDLEQNIEDTPKPVLRAIKQLQCRPESLSSIRKALFSHTNGFIRFDERDETFQFDHPVVSDAVGLVLHKFNRTALLKNCDVSFIERYISIKTPESVDKTAIRITVMPPRYGQLCLRLGTLILQRTEGENLQIDIENEPKSQRYMDCTILKHPAFGEKDFCAEFFKTMHESEMILELLTASVSTIVAELTAFGNIHEKKTFETEIGILAYSLMQQSGECFARQCFQKMQDLVTENDDVKQKLQTDLYMTMLVATLSGDTNKINFLVEEMGAQADEFSLIHAASEAADKNTLDLLLQHSGKYIKDYREITERKQGLLITFIKKQNSRAVECILSSQYLGDGEINYKRDQDSRTALHIACKCGHQEIVGTLLKKNPDLSIKDAKQKCPIHLAALHGKIDTVKQLLDHDLKQADYVLGSYKGRLGMKLYHIAVMKENTEIMQTLKSKVLPVCVDGKKQTPLVFALQENKCTMISQLIDVSIENHAHTILDQMGKTALQIAEGKMSTLESTEEKIIYQDVISKLQSAISEQPGGSNNHEGST